MPIIKSMHLINLHFWTCKGDSTVEALLTDTRKRTAPLTAALFETPF